MAYGMRMAWPDCLHYTLRKRTPTTVMRRKRGNIVEGSRLRFCSGAGESFRFHRLRLATRRQLSGASGAGKAALEANFAVTRSWLRFRWVSQVSQIAKPGAPAADCPARLDGPDEASGLRGCGEA
jgi:hypothetical protein